MRPSDQSGRHSRPGDDEPVPRTGSARTDESGDGYGSASDGVPAASPRSGRRHAAPGYGDPEPGYVGRSTGGDPYGADEHGVPGYRPAGYGSPRYGATPYDAPGYGSPRHGSGYGSLDGSSRDAGEPGHGSPGHRSASGPPPSEDDPLGGGYGSSADRSLPAHPLGGPGGRGVPPASPTASWDGRGPTGHGPLDGGRLVTGAGGHGTAAGPNGYGPAAAGPADGFDPAGGADGYGPAGGGPASGFGPAGAANGYRPAGGGPTNGYGPASGGPTNGYGRSAGGPTNGHGPAAGGPNGHGPGAGPATGYGPAGGYGPPNGQGPAAGYGPAAGRPANGYGPQAGGPTDGFRGPGGGGADGQRPAAPQDRPPGTGPAFAGAPQPHGAAHPGAVRGAPPAGPGDPAAAGSGPTSTGTPGTRAGSSASVAPSAGGAAGPSGDGAGADTSTSDDDGPAAPLLAGGTPPPRRDGAPSSPSSPSGTSTTGSSRSAAGDDAATSAVAGGTRHRRGAGSGPGRGGGGAGEGPDDGRPMGRAARRAAAAGGGGRKSKRKGSFWRELPLLIVVAVVLTFLIQTFVARIYVIPSASMEQTLHGCTGCTNDRVAVDKVSYRFSNPAPGDVVVFQGPPAWSENDEVDSEEPSGNALVRGFDQALSLIGLASPNEKDFVKRVIATEGQTVACCDAQNRVTVDGQPLTEPYLYYQPDTPPAQQPFDPVVVPPGQLWVMGDNRNNSADSRFHGPIGTADVIGKAQIIVLPVSRWGGVPDPNPQAPPSALGAPGWTSAAPPGAGLLLAVPVVGVSRRLRERSVRAGATTSGGAGTPDDARREDDQE